MHDISSKSQQGRAPLAYIFCDKPIQVDQSVVVLPSVRVVVPIVHALLCSMVMCLVVIILMPLVAVMTLCAMSTVWVMVVSAMWVMILGAMWVMVLGTMWIVVGCMGVVVLLMPLVVVVHVVLDPVLQHKDTTVVDSKTQM